MFRLPRRLRRSDHDRLRALPTPVRTAPAPVVVRVDFVRRARTDAGDDTARHSAALRSEQ